MNPGTVIHFSDPAPTSSTSHAQSLDRRSSSRSADSSFTFSQSATSTLTVPGTRHSTSPDAVQHQHPPEQRKMANIKVIKRKTRARSRKWEERDDSPGHTRAGRSVKIPESTVDRTSEVLPDNLSSKPAAFPSLPTNTLPPPPTAIVDFDGNGMKELMDAMQKGDSESVSAIHTHFGKMYKASTDMWYAELRSRWSPNESNLTVSRALPNISSILSYQVSFESLWPCLRQAIVEQIQAEFTDPDTLYPVQRILGLSRSQLFDIMANNAQVWDTQDIPRYYRGLKHQNPDTIIDPDHPPPAQVVRAIMFLKQQRLPGALLGEWSTLPPIQVFRP